MKKRKWMGKNDDDNNKWRMKNCQHATNPGRWVYTQIQIHKSFARVIV